MWISKYRWNQEIEKIDDNFATMEARIFLLEKRRKK